MPILTKDQVHELLEELERDPNVKGVLLTGSYAYGKPNNKSDIEIVCIVRDGQNSCERNRKFHGVPTEIFYNSPEKIRNEYWPQATEEGHGDCIHFWAHGIVIHDEDGTVEALQKDARKLWLKGPSKRKNWNWRWKKHGKGYPEANWSSTIN